MRFTTLFLGAASAALLTGPALAQDVPDDSGFSGIYVGGTVGFDSQPNDVGETIEFDRNLDGKFGDTVLNGAGANAFSRGFCNGRARGNSPGGGCLNDRDDISYAARVGGDVQLGSIVVGAVGEFGKSDIRDSVSAFSTTPASYTFNRELKWEASIRGRAGFTPNNSTLFYGSAGAGYARVMNRFTTTNTANTFTDTGNDNRWGLLAGGGVEQKLGRNFSIGVEYMFHRYKDDDYRVRAGGAAGTPFTNAATGGSANGTDFRRNFDYFRWHSIRATAAFRF